MWGFISLVLLLVAFFFIMQQSTVQTWFARKAASYLSRQLETNVYIEKLKVSFPLDIDARNFGIDDRQGMPVLRTQNLQFGLYGLGWKARNIEVGRIALENPEINIITYAGDTVPNFQFILDYVGADDTEPKPSEPWSFRLLNASISNGTFSLRDFNYEPEPKGIDFNHLKIDQLHLVLSDLTFADDTMQTRLHHLSAVEQSGFVLNRLRAALALTPSGIIAQDLIIQTPNSDLLLDLAFLFENFSDWNDFLEKVYIQADMYPSDLYLADLSYFVPELSGMDNRFSLDGKVRGEVSNLRLRDLNIRFAEYTTFSGNLSLDGLPDFTETFMHINVREFNTHYRDLEVLKLPSENGPVFADIPEEIKKLEHINIKGRFTGFYNDFVSDGTFNTALGNITTDISLQYDFDTKDIVYSGKLDTRRFNLGLLLDEQEVLGYLNMKATVDGTGQLPDTFDGKFVAEIDSVDFMGNNLNSLIVNGDLSDKRFNGSLELSDELVHLDFQGMFDFSGEVPVFNFTADLNDAFLSRLNLIERDYSSRLSTKVDFNFSGSNLDNLHGRILINDTWYYESGEEVIMDRFVLNAHPVDNGNRKLSLRSDYMDADFDGDFSYSMIYPAFRNIIHDYMPSLQLDTEGLHAEIPDQSFIAAITLKNTQPLSRLFIPEIVIDSDVKIEGNFNSGEGLVGVLVSAPEISLVGATLRNWNFVLNTRNRELNMRTGATHFLFKEADKTDALELGIENILLSAGFSGDTISYQLAWENKELPRNNSGTLDGFFTFANAPLLEFRITESDMVVNDIPWRFNTGNYLIIDSTSININNLVFESSDQKIMLNGKISQDPVEKMNIAFENWKLANLDVLLAAYGVDISGAITGTVELVDVYDNFTFLADLTIDDFHMNQERFGDLYLNTSWDTYTQAVWVDSQIEYTGNVGTIIPFRLHGFYYPERENDNFDLELELYNFRLEFTNPFLVDILSDIRGLASGEVTIKGNLSSPEVNGKIALMRTEFVVDFTNTHYSLSDVILIEKDRIYANNVDLFDQYGNSGTANLMFTHKNFDDWRMDLRIQANNLAGLKTTASDNDLFYGTAFATGNVTMNGSFNDLDMNIRVRSDPQTFITIPISFAVDVAQQDFIIFTGAENGDEEMLIDETDPFALRVNMDFDVTPDAQIQIFLPYQMGNIRSSGSGNMKMHYNTAGDFSLFGEYVTSQGTFLFTLQNMVSRTFNLLPGGTLRWSGDPYDADINMRAVYRTRATLNSLPTVSEQFHNRRYPVDCILTLRNSLMNPEISFSIRMPNVDEEIQRQVFSAVDTTNEVIMSRQMISLLVLNSFNFAPDQTNIASTLSASSFELLSNQLNSWLSQISKDFDIGVNYRPGDQLSSEELELALSTQLFEDRVIIDGNIGMIGEHGSQSNASNIIGDINVEFLVTRDGRLRLKAFNKYNDMEISQRDAAYTQGVGISYRREFTRIRDIWRSPRPIKMHEDWPNGNSYNSNGLNREATKPEED